MRIAASALLLLAFSHAPAQVGYHNEFGRRECCLVVAHAAGGIEGNAYTNSEEALLANLRAGARVFEIDFSPTRDGVWVGTHDWETWKSQTRHAGALPPSYGEFTAAKLVFGASRYTGLTLGFLEKTLAAHKDALIVTDTKYDLAGLARALRETTLARRVVPQAYSPADVEMLRGLGYARIILTVYKLNLREPQKLLDRIMARKPEALTVPLDFFAANHARIARLALPVYVHGDPAKINSRELHYRLRGQGATGFYLD